MNRKYFTTIKQVREAFKNNCFYVYLLKSESKLRVIGIRTVKGQIQAKILYYNRSFWCDCTLNELFHQ